MRTERQRKIELLARKNLAKREHPNYLSELSSVLKHPITEENLLDLETTDQLFGRFNEGTAWNDPQSSLKCRWSFNPTSRWIRICFCLAKQLGSEEVALFAGPYSRCGAVRTKAECPLTNAPAVIEFDRDTVRLQSLTSNAGLYVDWYEESGDRWIELKVWGDWSAYAKTCVS
jgi:hypothetical protein